jgi:hypothetical protein
MTEAFIQKAREMHGDKYDYCKTVYENNLKEVIIICKEHGEFLQLPKTHKRGNGCKKCGRQNTIQSKTSDTHKFIQKAIEIHKDKYDYSKVEYKKAIEKVIIICKKHGEFYQTPNGHLSSAGCKKCATDLNILNQSSTTITFIENAKNVHGDKYDYSKVIYINNSTKIIIICKEHREFKQAPASHLVGSGCNKCGILSTSQKNSSNTEEFIKKAIEINGDKYDYSKVNYINTNTKVIIICKKHGEFYQLTISHINGAGCSKCNGGCKLTTPEFIKKARDIHGDKYDYSKVEYKKSNTNVIIICKKHDYFLQQPNNHLNGQNCPNCRISNHSKKQIEWLTCMSIFYKINIQHAEHLGEYKIPHTKYKADGYCKETNTVYEFHGDYWHGNPKIYDMFRVNKIKKMTFGQAYQNTKEREKVIENLGYNLVVMWEYDWNKIVKSVKILQRKFRGSVSL